MRLLQRQSVIARLIREAEQMRTVVVLGLVAALPLTATAQRSGAPVKPQPARAAATATAPDITEAVLGELRAQAKVRFARTLLGVSKNYGTLEVLSVGSNRAVIAAEYALAAERGGRYTPPKASLDDVVVVTCGAADLRETFDCARVGVTDPANMRIAPIYYRAAPQTFRNALGNNRVVRRVSATFPIRNLKNGFTVTAASDQGVEVDLTISARQAAFELLLTDDPSTWRP
jgi:hypothetical protein